MRSISMNVSEDAYQLCLSVLDRQNHMLKGPHLFYNRAHDPWFLSILWAYVLGMKRQVAWMQR